MEDGDPFLNIFDDIIDFATGSESNSHPETLDQIPCRGSLAELIGSDLYTSPYAGPVQGGHEAEIREVEGRIRLVISPANIDYETRVGMSDDLNRLLQEADGFPLATAAGIADAVKGEVGKEYIEGVISFYRGKVPPRFREPLIEGMALRYAENNYPIAQWRVQQRKRETASAHAERGYDPVEAYHTASMCSSGYFDSDRLFQGLYYNKVNSGDWSDGDYANAFEELVSDGPFVVFVESDASVQDVYADMLSQSLDMDEYMFQSEFIDIRGKGTEARRKVLEVMEFIDDNHEADHEIDHGNGQSNLRVYHETL